MKRGFTIIELLVASLLLGMLVTLLTMLFNQSSIAWRIGEVAVADMDSAREQVASVRVDDDNAVFWDGKCYMLQSLWNDDGGLRERAVDEGDQGWFLSKTRAQPTGKKLNSTTAPRVNVTVSASSQNFTSYRVNVKSSGPNGVQDDWDDIWSDIDEFD